MALEFLLDYVPPPTVAAFCAIKQGLRSFWGRWGRENRRMYPARAENAMEQAPDRDGIRRSRHVVVRNTMPQLKLTTIKSFWTGFPHGVLGRWVSSDKTYYMRFNDVEAEVIFLALDDKDDVAKLLSLETTTAWFNEFREIDQDIFEGMTKRIGRYPSKKGGPGPTYKCIIADSNMPAVDTWLYNMARAAHRQQLGRVQAARRARSAGRKRGEPAPGYYDPTGLSDEYVQVMIDAQYGTSQAGCRCIGTFVKSFHVSTAPQDDPLGQHADRGGARRRADAGGGDRAAAANRAGVHTLGSGDAGGREDGDGAVPPRQTAPHLRTSIRGKAARGRRSGCRAA